LKIIELRGENVKRIKAIRIRPKDNMVIISGKNGAGKTSCLDLIWYCLDGGKGLKDTPIPIRKGETKAKAITVLAEPTEADLVRGAQPQPLFTVTRTWTEKGSYLKVTNAQGEVQQSPQELLDSFVGRLAFDPLKFAQMKEKEQRELLLKLADIDLEVLDNEIADVREKRRSQGQEVKLLTGGREEIEEGLPKEPIDVTKLSDEYDKAININQNIKDTIKQGENNQESITENAREIDRLTKEIETLNEDTKNLVKANENMDKWLAENKPIETALLKDKITKAYAINDQIKARERNKAADKREQDAREKYDGFTSKVDELEDIKKGILDDAKMPIKGLSITDTGVAFNSIPFSQLSASEQLKVSMGLAIAMNPKLKVLRITDGSLLDDRSMELIKLMAKKYDFQIWIERVDSSGEVGFVIEDGEVK